ncbi:MAG: flippase [Bacteroidetes bacterium]|nr:flippase [Bacteroidota bacterium]
MKAYNKFLAFTKKEENKELLVHSMIALIVRIAGAGSTFLMNVIIARHLGVKESGYFFLAVTIAIIVGTIGRVGADQSVLRFISIYSKEKDWEKVHGVINTLMKWGVWVTSITAIVICIFAGFISTYFFHKPEMKYPLIWIALSVPFFACYNLFGMALQGLRKVFLSVTVLKIIAPIALIILVFVWNPTESTTASMLFFFSSIIAALISFYWWRKDIPNVKGKFDTAILWKSSSSLWVVAIMQQLIIWSGQFIAGVFNTPQELATLAVARNTSVLITFLLAAVGYVSAPRFASMYKENKLTELERYVRNTTRLLIVTSLPIILFMWFFPNFLMSLFGKGFEGGSGYLRVLVLGQFINVATGSVGYLLTMSGHEKDMRNITIINGVLAVVLALILNPIFGAMGSAISTAIAVALSNIMAVGMVKKRLGFNPINILGI